MTISVAFRRASMACLAAGVLHAAAASARSGSRGADELRDVVARYYEAWNTLDTSKAAAFYAKDRDAVFYDITPLEYRSWADYAAGVNEHFFGKVETAKLAPRDDLKVTRRGDVAWTTLTFDFTFKLRGGPDVAMLARHTAIWERRAGRWLVVHEHVSVPLPE